MDSLRSVIYHVAEKNKPVTIRQLFYRLTVLGVVAKTEAEYKGTVCRMTAKMRREGELPFGWVADSTRWMRKPETHGSLESMLALTQQTYRRAIWDNQPVYIEIWLEKDALSGVLLPVTSEWDVPLMVTRGYPSITFLHSAAEEFANLDKPAFVYYFGDHDPSGVDIPIKVEAGLREFAPDVDLTFKVVAVTRNQIDEYGLPSRPTKKTDSRAKSFVGDSVEVDALEPDVLREICRSCVTQHINASALERLQAAEAAERETLEQIVANLEGAA